MAWDSVAFVTLAIFLAGVIFHTGRLTARVDELERWRTELRDELREIRTLLQTISRSFELP